MYLADLQEKYHDYLYEKNLVRSVLAWATKQNLPNSVIHFELHTKQESYTRTTHGWSRNNRSQEASIIVYRPDITEAENRMMLLTQEKVTLFASTDVHIVEILNEDSPRLLRHGITHEEKDLLLVFSRAFVEHKLLQKPLPSEIEELVANNPRFKQVTGVDVVMWVNGTMRGSIIKTGLPLLEAIQESCVASLSDSRFKPIESEELAELTLEINILSDLHIPLPSKFKQTQPEEQKGYFVTQKHNTGWYLPAVFNSQKYRDLPHLLNELATKKASIAHTDVPHARFYHFEVTTFAEIPHDSSTTSAQDKINAAADWMLSIQDKKGFMPTIVSPYDSTSHKADWVRMALAALALNEYGVIQGKEAYTMAARLTFDYIVSTIDGLAILSHPNYILCVIYLCRLAIANNDLTKASGLFQKIESKLRSTQLSTIAQLQLASLYTEMTTLDKKYQALAINIIETEYRTWESATSQNKSETSYAEYAEFIPLLYNLSSTNAEYVPNYQKIMSWYLEAQQTNGAFPNTQRSSYCYTRGTGKIFEAMSIDEKNIDSVHNSLSWTLSLQYTHRNLFYIPPSERRFFSGAIMHDSFDHSAWTDSVSHLLIGAARLHKIRPDLLN